MALSLDTIHHAALAYFAKLDTSLKPYGLAGRAPSTIAWKVTDIDEYGDALADFLKNNLIAQCHIGYVDKRYIASIVFKQPIYKNTYILKLMQRRPGSTDAVGLDHADFPVDDLTDFEIELTKKLANQKALKWSYESNEVHRWISVWFDGSEAKFVDHIVLDVGVKELQDITTQLGFAPKTVGNQ